MFRVIAASFVAVWLALFAIEFSESIGLINPVDADESVETAMTSFGEAIRALGDSQTTVSLNLSVHYEVVPASPDPSHSIEHVSFHLRKEAEFSKAHLNIYKLQQVFLI